MFCGNCGAENPDGTKFCGKCGQPLIPMPSASNENVGSTQTSQTAQKAAGSAQTAAKAAGEAVGKLKKLPKGVLIGICAAVVAAIVLIVVGVNAANTINLDKYITFNTEGYDGYGRARVTIDWNAIEQKYGNKVSYTNAATKEAGDFLGLATPIEALEECVDVELEPSTGLSNGDEVTYKWNIENDTDKYLKVKLKHKDGSFKVSDLQKVGTFEAFDDVTVTFDGIAPNGTANVQYNGSELSPYDFSIDKYDGLSNGDEVTVTIADSSAESCAETYGKVPATREKTYTVEGLQSSVTKLADIDEDALEGMKSQASDVFNAYVANYWEAEYGTLQDFTYIGDYLLTAKSSDIWGSQNTLYLVFKFNSHLTISDDSKTFDQVIPGYWYIAFSNLMVDEDGKVAVDVTKYSTPGDSFRIDTGVSQGWYSNVYFTYVGYQTLDDLYKEVVTSNQANYNVEENVKESVSSAT